MQLTCGDFSLTLIEKALSVSYGMLQPATSFLNE
jgi:hypothetical protein